MYLENNGPIDNYFLCNFLWKLRDIIQYIPLTLLGLWTRLKKAPHTTEDSHFRWKVITFENLFKYSGYGVCLTLHS